MSDDFIMDSYIVIGIYVILFGIFFIEVSWVYKRYSRLNLPSQEIFEEFKQKYYLYLDNMTEIEGLRKKAIIGELYPYILIGAILLTLVFLENFVLKFFSVIVLILGISYIFFKKGWLKKTKNYKSVYVDKIIKPIVKLVNKNLNYSEWIGKTSVNIKEAFDYIDFDRWIYNSFKQFNHLYGEIVPGIGLDLSNISVKYRGGSYTHEVFNGVFGYSRINKHFSNAVEIICKKKQKRLVENKVKIDDEEFKKIFIVYSDNEEEALKLLNFELRTKILNLYNKYKLDFEIGVKGNYIFYRFFNNKLKKIKVFRKSTRIENLYEYYYIVKYMIEIIEEINLYFDGLE